MSQITTIKDVVQLILALQRKVNHIDEKLDKVMHIEEKLDKVLHIDEKLDKILAKFETLQIRESNKVVVVRKVPQTAAQNAVVEPTVAPKSTVAPQPTVDDFAFRPIENQKEAISLANKLRSDEGFAQRLHKFLSAKGDLKLDDMYSPRYLCSQTFVMLNKTLLFKNVFVRIKKNEGYTEASIENYVVQKIRDIKEARRKYELEKMNHLQGVVKIPVISQVLSAMHEQEAENDEEMDIEEENGMGDLEPGEIPIKIEKPESPDPSFVFTPIQNDAELKQISKKIRQDSLYKTQLRRFIKKIGNFTVTDLFTETFLLSLLEGKNELHTLQTLEPFEQIYVFLKFTAGEGSQDTIRQSALAEINAIRERFPPQEPIIPMDTVRVKIEDDPSCSSSSQPEIQNFALYENDASTFVPIRNEDDLEKLTEKLKNPQYVKDLQQKLMDEATNQNCKLEQIFSVEFLRQQEVFDNGQARLEGLKAYKVLYVECKKQQGCSMKDIKEQTKQNLTNLWNHPKMIIHRLRKK
ncbi:uncharacterized protein LOC134834369 [Culicoides brevitarsis]|uniref:uncharacterized protein LOC134834369 n=1 Tax=Culicoides brevitarsis TaxID=469753 RepID=UPI00307B54F8